MTAPSPAEQAQTRQHAREGRMIYFATLAWEVLLFAAFFLLGGTRALAALARRAGAHWWLAVLLVGAVFLLGWTICILPFDVYTGFFWQHRWGLSHQTLAQWAGDWALEASIFLGITLVLLLLAYFIICRCPRTWWLWLAIASAPLIFAGEVLQPLVIDPLFNRFVPLADPMLKQDILALASAQGLPVHDVYIMDASRQGGWVNAYVTGIGPSRRIVLYDTLVKQFPQDEVLFITAHELGHTAHHDIPIYIVLGVIGAFAGSYLTFRLSRSIISRFRRRLGIRFPADPAGLPVLTALVFALMLVATPIESTITRTIESRADRFAITAYPHPTAAISAFHRLAALNLDDEDPPAWVELFLYTHPSIRHRIEAVLTR